MSFETITTDALSFQPQNIVDVYLCGWCFHELKAAAFSEPDIWQSSFKNIFDKMIKSFPKNNQGNPQGIIVILETLGTSETPTRTGSHYYQFLKEYGFTQSCIQTDYRFSDKEIAKKLVRFFFGESTVSLLKEKSDGIYLSEWTAVFQLHFS